MVKEPEPSKSDDHPGTADEGIEVPDRGEAAVEAAEEPPPSVHERIHRRRPAPLVPDAEPPEGE